MKTTTIVAIARAFNDADVPFIVVGGLAVVAHGYGRATQDLDVVIELKHESIHAAFRALGSLAYRPSVPVTADAFADPSQRKRWITEKGMTVLNFVSDQHRQTPVGVFVAEPFDFDAEYNAAGVEELSAGVAIRIVRLETLIRLKEEVGRPQDVADVAELRRLLRERRDG